MVDFTLKAQKRRVVSSLGFLLEQSSDLWDPLVFSGPTLSSERHSISTHQQHISSRFPICFQFGFLEL